MTGLDTNVVVRLLAKDDEPQLESVLALLRKRGAFFFVPDLVLIETCWVLTTLYDWTQLEVVEAFEMLLTIHNLAFEDEGRLRAALRRTRAGAGFADELIVDECRDFGCKNLASFDKGMAKRHPSFVVNLK